MIFVIKKFQTGCFASINNAGIGRKGIQFRLLHLNGPGLEEILPIYRGEPRVAITI
jgi:hypothetical protein